RHRAADNVADCRRAGLRVTGGAGAIRMPGVESGQPLPPGAGFAGQGKMMTRFSFVLVLLCVLDSAALSPPVARAGEDEAPAWIRSARSGPWSAPATWQGGKTPPAGARVQIRAGDVVTYDLDSDRAIRAIHVAGTLTFARDRTTRLDVGLIKIEAGDEA